MSIKIKKTITYLLLITIFLFAEIVEASVGGTSRTWPWDAFLKSLAQELTGPLPTTLGILGVVGAAGALIMGHGGDSTRKFLVLVLGVSVALSAPTLIGWLTSDSGYGSATGAIIGGF